MWDWCMASRIWQYVNFGCLCVFMVDFLSPGKPGVSCGYNFASSHGCNLYPPFPFSDKAFSLCLHGTPVFICCFSFGVNMEIIRNGNQWKISFEDFDGELFK